MIPQHTPSLYLVSRHVSDRLFFSCFVSSRTRGGHSDVERSLGYKGFRIYVCDCDDKQSMFVVRSDSSELIAIDLGVMRRTLNLEQTQTKNVRLSTKSKKGDGSEY
jgi:hypothetical protein